jgi:dipeptidyl aminopeptidase/acylaminoacyl peptidase
MTTSLRTAVLTGLVALLPSVTLVAQLKPAQTADYGQWETLVSYPRASSTGPLSPDGRWLVYGISRSNRNNELRVVQIGSDKPIVAAFGDQPAFSADSRWLAYSIGVSEAEEEKQQKARRPVRRKLGLLNLATGETTTIDEIEAFAFNASGSHLAMRRYAPEAPRGEQASSATPASSEERPRPGTVLMVRELSSGADTTFGNVAEYAWQSSGPQLAMALSVEGQAGNGVQLFNPAAGMLRVLDSSAATYTGLTWRKDSADLVVLRSKTDSGHDGPTHAVLAWRAIGAAPAPATVLDPTVDGILPRNRRVVAWRRPEWSKDGSAVFVGVADWEQKTDGSVEDAAEVDVWHWRDVDVIPLQEKRIATDRQRNVLAVWHLDGRTLLPLATSHLDDVRILEGQSRALVLDRAPYAMQRSIGRRHADAYLVDLKTGARSSVKSRIEDQYLQVSPDGRALVYFQDDHYWAYDLATNTHTNLTKAIASSFVDRESDATVKQKPPFGVAGWVKGGGAVWLYDKFDIWEVATSGKQATRITEGTAEQVRHRLVRLDPDEPFIDRSTPVFLSLMGEWTKRYGYARLDPSAPRPERTVWVDKNVARLTRAKSADVFAYVVQSFDDSPDYFVTDGKLSGAKQMTTTNAFQEKYAWGRAELVDYKTTRGERLQGALFYPAGYEPGKKYPMVVYMYEQLSDGVHNYSSPSDRQPYNAGVFTSHGYFFFQPDIVFRPREPGLSVVECVVPAVKAVLQKGAVDPARVGIVGHSWGGFDTVYLSTHTDTFAAGVAGAPITNLVSNYGSHHWSSGIAETDHIETGQQRMEVPLWEDLPAYIRNSAVYGAHSMKTPLLVAFGENDGTVHWHQGVELYNIARRAEKPVVLLAYAGEDHSLRKRANQQDYHRRIIEWFGHYLKGEPAAPWIRDGVSALEREKELKKKLPTKPTTDSSERPR